MNQTGCVYLVGAGCGGAEWLTLRAKELLENCGAVVADDLIDPAIPALAPQAELFCAGKRAGRASTPQTEINELLIRLAREGKTVVRLKGGDPFVFGRGGEEALALRAAGIRCEEVPGISSCIAIPAAAGIPVTHRGVSRSFHVVTGHTSDGGAPECAEALAALDGTLVFLMGLGGIEEIAARLIAGGKPSDTPAAVVAGGNAPRAIAVRGTLADIAHRVREAGVQAPAVVVVGGVAALDVRGAALALEGVRVGLVGTPSFTRRAAQALRRFGARPVLSVSARVLPLETETDWSVLAARKSWIVLTSRNGVERWFSCLREAGADVRSLHACRFAVIGPATADALKEHGIIPDVCASPATSAALAAALAKAAAPGETAALFRSLSAGDELPAALREAGLRVAEYATYDVEYLPVSAGPAACLIFGSALGARAYWKAFGAPEPDAACIAVGPVTARALRELGADPILAEEISAESAARAAADHCSRLRN